jgi:vitamin B12 transporter
MHRLAFCICCFSIGAALAASPTITGLITDPAGRPVPGARVECSGSGPKTFSDATGRFTVGSSNGCRALITAEGFETKQVDLVASAQEVRIGLAIATLSQRMVVSATRRDTTVEETGAAASVIGTTDLAQRQFPFVADALREIPGISVVQSGRPGSLVDIYTRGGASTGTLVLLDGVPLNDPGGQINSAPLVSSAVDRIEMVRGPQSALFGAEASSGVIQIFSRSGDPEAKRPHGFVSYERGGYQTDRWAANLNGGSGRALDYSLTAEQFHTVGMFPNDYYRNTTGTASIGYRLTDATQLHGVFRQYDAVDGSPNQVGYGLIDYNARLADRDTAVSLRLDDVRGPRFVQRAAFGYHRLSDLYTDLIADGPYSVAALVRDVPAPAPRTYLVKLLDTRYPLPTPAAGTRIVAMDYLLWPLDAPSLSLTARQDFDYQGTLTHTGGAAVFGYTFERQAGNISLNDVSRMNNGGFVHEQRTFFSRLYLSAGARVEHNSAFGTSFTPRAAAAYRLFGQHGVFSTTMVRASAGRGITDPSLLENYARESTYYGNPNLRPEHTTSFDFGVVQEWFGRRLRTELAAFSNSFRDSIVFVWSDTAATWQNVAAARARGLEFSVETKPVRYVTLAASHTFLDGRVTQSSYPDSPFTGVGQELMRRPRHASTFSALVAPRRWSFQASAIYAGERQDADLFGINRNPGYWRVSAGASWRATRHVTPFLRTDNLLNMRYAEALGYTALGRTVRVGSRVEW